MKKIEAFEKIPEIDQSGKVEDLNTLTVVGFFGSEQGTISISAGEKRKAVAVLRKSTINPSDISPKMFAVLVFILTKNLGIRKVDVDEEYTGKDDLIFGVVNRLRAKSGRKELEMRFVLVGKSSPVHQLVWRAHRFRKSPSLKKVTALEMLRLLKN